MKLPRMNKGSSNNRECCHWGQGNNNSLQLNCQCLGVLLQLMFLVGIINGSASCLLILGNSELLMILAKSYIFRLVHSEERWVEQLCIWNIGFKVWPGKLEMWRIHSLIIPAPERMDLLVFDVCSPTAAHAAP